MGLDAPEVVRLKGDIHGQDLSRREKQVLEALIAEGYIYLAAYRLGVSRYTVKTHLDRIRRKYGVDTTLQAVALYQATS